MSRTNWLYLRRKSRRVEAVERQVHYDTLTLEQRMALVNNRRGVSKKEFKRLLQEASNE